MPAFFGSLLAHFERIRPLLEELDGLDHDMRAAAQTPRGRLRITAPLTFGVVAPAPALAEFAARFPEIALEAQFSDRIASLVDEGFDLAVRIGRPADGGLVSRPLGAVRLMLVGSDACLAAGGAPERPEDLARHACILDLNIREPGRCAFRDAFMPVSGRLRFANAEACRIAAEAGLGLAYLPDFVAAPALAAGRLRRLLAAHEAEPLGLHALHPHGRHLATKVRALVDFLAERFRRAPK